MDSWGRFGPISLGSGTVAEFQDACEAQNANEPAQGARPPDGTANLCLLG
jgi:hypothetical protein